MMGITHLLIGVSVTIAIQDPSLPVIATAAIASLMPDIDHPRSIVGRALLGAPAALLPHRGPTHSALFVLLLGLVVWSILPANLAFAAIIGYVGHLLADSLTNAGIPAFWPMSGARIRAPLTIATGGIVESFLGLFLAIFLIMRGIT